MFPYRVLKKNRAKGSKSNCVVCKQACVDEKVPKIICRINPNLYDGRVTRSVTKLLESMKDFIIVETYRCMPLLGNETESAPDWDVHIVRFAIVFINQKH